MVYLLSRFVQARPIHWKSEALKAETHVEGGAMPAEVVTVPVIWCAARRVTFTSVNADDTLIDWAEFVTVQEPAGPSNQPPPKVGDDRGPWIHTRMLLSAGSPLSVYEPSFPVQTPPSHSHDDEMAETQAN